MKDLKLFTQRVGLIGITNIIVTFKGIILLPILTKTIAEEGYGIWTQILVTIGLISPIATLNLSPAVVRFLSSKTDKSQIKEAFSLIFFTVLISGTVFTLALYLISEPLSTSFFKFSSHYLQISSILVLITALNIVTLEFFRPLGQMKNYAYLIILRTILEIVFIAYTVLSGYGVEGAIISLIIAAVIVQVMALGIIFSKYGCAVPRFSHLRPYLVFGLPILLLPLIGWIIHSSDRYVIGYIMNVDDVGIYSAAYNIGAVVLAFIAPIQFVLYPTVSKLRDEKNFKGARSYLNYSLKFFLMLSIPSAFGLSVLSRELLLVITQESFTEAYLIVALVSFGCITYGVHSIYSYILLIENKTKILGFIMGFGAIFNLALNIILVPEIGIDGAAISTLLTFVIIAIFAILISRRYLPLKPDIKFIGKCILASSVMALIVWKISEWGTPSVLHFLLEMVLGIGIYFGLLMALRGFGKRELDLFKKMLIP
ncbi:MAG: flippase [Methanomassiliicoccales archaeon]|nr:MAG: flippase [Methanomassiliicoccales archaeon]